MAREGNSGPGRAAPAGAPAAAGAARRPVAGRDGAARVGGGDGAGRRWWFLAGASAALVAAAIGYVAYSAASPPGTALADQGNQHINLPSERKVEYNSDPPTSGPHFPYIAPWGIHTEPVPKELQVHNLEDGGVMVQYHCPSPCPDLVDKLKVIVNRYPEQVILAPYPGLAQRIALTAWARIDTFDQFDEGRIVRFIKAYRGIDHHK